MAYTIAEDLNTFGILDFDEYLVPPGHPNVLSLRKRMYELMETQHGLKLSLQDERRLQKMQRVFDYYNEEFVSLRLEDFVRFVVDDEDFFRL